MAVLLEILLNIVFLASKPVLLFVIERTSFTNLARRVFVSTPKTRKPGICVKCGYDLRATPGRCPECGTVPTRWRA